MRIDFRQPKVPRTAWFGRPIHTTMTGAELVTALLNAGDMIFQPCKQGFGLQLFLRGQMQLRTGQAGCGQTAADLARKGQRVDTHDTGLSGFCSIYVL